MDQLTKDLFFMLIKNRRSDGRMVKHTGERAITDIELALRDAYEFVDLINKIAKEHENESKPS